MACIEELGETICLSEEQVLSQVHIGFVALA